MPFTKLSSVIDLPRFGSNGPHRYTDTNEFLSPGVLLAYKARAGHPTMAMKTTIQNAAVQARNIVRIANDEMAKVVIMRRNESATFTATMERHFNLKANGDTAGGWLEDNVIDKPFKLGAIFKKDRRWVLEQIRQKMLSLSFHLNTGVYLIEIDAAGRNVDGGQLVPAGTAETDTTRGYVYRWGAGAPICGFRNGEIHIAFEKFPTHSLNSGARIIIHEAAHKYLDVKDTYYAWHPNYPPSLRECLEDNADSFAWAAVSLATGAVRMASDVSPDGQNCPGARL